MSNREKHIKLVHAFADAKKGGRHWFLCPLCNGDAIWRKIGEGAGGVNYSTRCLNCDLVTEILELREKGGVENA